MRRRFAFPLVLGLTLLVISAARSGPASAEDAPPPPPVLSPAEALFLPLKEKVHALETPFLRDTDVKLHLRLFYFNREKPDDSENEALAFGGWVGYKSGWLLDTFAMGATLYGSAPLYAPTNGVAGQHNIAVETVLPGQTDYPPLWGIIMVTWKAGAHKTLLTSAAQVTNAERAGRLTIKKTALVVNCPVVP